MAELNKTYTNQVGLPDLTSVLDATKNSTSKSLNCCQIGIIQSFDASNQLASVQISIRQIISIAPDGTRTFSERPTIINKVPCFTFFGGNSYLTMPIAEGDNCILLFNDVEIDQWVASGDNQAPVTQRSHDISDAIALVGIRNLQNSISDFISNGVRLSFSDNSRITLTEDLITSVATLFTHNGNMKITGGLTLGGDITSISGAAINFDVSLTQTPGKEIHAGNGATGTYNIVTVVDGIVVSGT